jgi:hypothetical protein
LSTAKLPTALFSVGQYVVINGVAYSLDALTGSGNIESYSGPYATCNQALAAATYKCVYTLDYCCGNDLVLQSFFNSNNIPTTYSISSSTVYDLSSSVYKYYPSVDVDVCWSVNLYDGITPFSAVTGLEANSSCGIGRCQRCILTLSSCTNGSIIMWTVQYDTPINENEIYFISGLDDATGAGNCAKVINPSTYGITSYNHLFTSYNESDYIQVTGCTDGACYNCASGVTITSNLGVTQTVYYTGCTGGTDNFVLTAGDSYTIPGCVDLSKTMAGITGTTSTPSYEVTSVGQCCSRSGVYLDNNNKTQQLVTYKRCTSSGIIDVSLYINGGDEVQLFGTVIMNTLTLPTNVVISDLGTCSACNP